MWCFICIFPDNIHETKRWIYCIFLFYIAFRMSKCYSFRCIQVVSFHNVKGGQEYKIMSSCYDNITKACNLASNTAVGPWTRDYSILGIG